MHTLLAVGALLTAVHAGTASEFRLAAFKADVTCPMGHALMGGGIAPAQEVLTPLYAKGVVLLGPDQPIVFCAVDWCEIRNDAYDLWRDALAEAAGTTRERVLVAAVHQHDTPVADFQAQRLLDEQGLEKALCDVPYVRDCVARTADALKASLAAAQPVTHYGMGEAAVEGVSSNRRVVADDGSVSFPRNSATTDAAIRDAPIDLHDPMLKTLSFWNGGKPVAALHAYSVHPMSFYGKGGVNYDFVGMAREQRQQDDPDVFQIYFSGCSGDTTAGKYNDGAPENRPVLAERMYQGMVKAWDATQKHALTDVDVRVAALVLEPRYTDEELRAQITDVELKTFDRILAAMGLSWRMRAAAGQAIDVPAVDFGQAQFLLMPAESFVGYQLMAQKLGADDLVITAGYGECAPGYIPTREATAENFIEHHTWCWVVRGCDEAMRTAMQEALNPKQGEN